MKICVRSNLAMAILVFCALFSAAQDQPAKVTAQWDKVIRTTQSTPTLQVVVNPPLERGTPVHDNAFQALHELGADYVRYVPGRRRTGASSEWEDIVGLHFDRPDDD